MPLKLGSALRYHIHRAALRQQLREARRELQAVGRDQQCILLDRIGEIHHELGEDHEALAYFGGAIDAALEGGHLDSAAGLCQKLLSLRPEVVRARGTLACLLLARGSYCQAEWEFVQYVKAARRQGTMSCAGQRLRLLQRAYGDRVARLLLARLLQQMGEGDAAREIEASADPDLTAAGQRELLGALLRRALLPRTRAAGTEAAYAWQLTEDPADPPPPPTQDLPILDLNLTRAVREGRSPRPAPLSGDLPWLDTEIPVMVGVAEPGPAPSGAPPAPEREDPPARPRVFVGPTRLVAHPAPPAPEDQQLN